VAPRLGGIKQKKLIIHLSTSLLFLFFYSPKPRNQVRILIYRKWSIVGNIAKDSIKARVIDVLENGMGIPLYIFNYNLSSNQIPELDTHVIANRLRAK